MDWLIEGVRIDNAEKRMRRFQDRRAQLAGLMQHFLRDVRVGEGREQLLFVLTEIHAVTSELFRFEEEVLSETTDSNKYRERYRNSSHKAKHKQILVDIDLAIRQPTASADLPGVQDKESRSCIAHAIDGLVMHMALEGRTLQQEAMI